MTPSEDPPQTLRNKAENQLTQTLGSSPDLSDKTPDEIIHELRVHQIELEIQNEKLKKAHQNLELSKVLDLMLKIKDSIFTSILTRERSFHALLVVQNIVTFMIQETKNGGI